MWYIFLANFLAVAPSEYVRNGIILQSCQHSLKSGVSRVELSPSNPDPNAQNLKACSHYLACHGWNTQTKWQSMSRTTARIIYAADCTWIAAGAQRTWIHALETTLEVVRMPHMQHWIPVRIETAPSHYEWASLPAFPCVRVHHRLHTIRSTASRKGDMGDVQCRTILASL